MALDPVGVHGVVVAQPQQLLPQVRVQRWLFVALHPAPLLPAPGPALLQSVDDVLAVGVQLHLAGLLQQRQGADHRGELHPVVGGAPLPAADLLLMGPVAQDRPPAPGPRVAAAGPVGINCYSFHKSFLTDGACCHPRAVAAPAASEWGHHRDLRSNIPRRYKLLQFS